LRLFSFGGYGLALAALALVVFCAYDSYPSSLPKTATSFFRGLPTKISLKILNKRKKKEKKKKTQAMTKA